MPTTENELPTVVEMFVRADTLMDTAHRALADAADWLRSDWQPLGASLTDAQAARRSKMFAEIEAAMAAIERARRS
jgi:hypothetical protein